MVKYIKCPRCELNYIDSEKQDYCDICLAEMKGSKLKFADIDEDEDLEQLELCPVCNTNYMKFGEKMCEACKKLSEYEQEEEVDPEQDEEWRNYLDDDTTDDLSDIPEGEIVDDEDNEDDEDEEADADEISKSKDDDDFDFPAGGEYSYAEDEEDEEEDDEEDEDDDF